MLDLLSLTWTFTQESLLSPSEFERECHRRGLSLISGQLEALDRAGVLRPIFEIDASLGNERLRSDTSTVRAAIAEGRIRSRYAGSEVEWPRNSSAPVRVAYSHYQLLSVPILERFLPKLEVQGAFDPTGPLRWTLNKEKAELIGVRIPVVDDELIVWLSFLEPVFLPRVRQSTILPIPFLAEYPQDRAYTPQELVDLDEKHQRAYFEYRRKVPRRELVEWMLTTPEHIAQRAERLLIDADFVDPLGDWLQIVRLAPGRWRTLEREALVALDHRIAAEMLFQLLHDLAEEGAVDKATYGRTGDLRKRHEHRLLMTDYVNREGILTDFDLSPHPISLVVIEGDTEQELAPLVMEEIGLPPPPWPIRLYNGRGVDSNLSWLYRFAWAFDVHEEIPGGFRPSRPLPYILILSDPEGRRQTPPQREDDRQKIVTKLQEDAEAAARRDPPRDLFDRRVRIEAWPKSLEFSHFSVEELIEAVRRLEPGLDFRLEQELAIEEAANLPRMTSLWHRLQEQGLVQRDLDKTALARALWPALQKRIREATDDEAQLRQIPLVAALLDAYLPVLEYPWGHFSYVPAGKP